MSLVRFSYGSPWTGLEGEINRLFESTQSGYTGRRTQVPVDLSEDNENNYVRAELPGVSREDINVEVADGYLTIAATRKQGEESFSLNRTVTVPEQVQADKVSASYENGVLTVKLPKSEAVKPRKITVS